MRRAAPDHGMGFGRVRMGQQGQRPLGREALPGPAGARQGGVRRGQHGVLAVVAAQVLAARAVGLHHHPAAQFGVALGDAHAVGVLLQDPGGRSRQQGHAALGDAGFEPGVEARIADHAAQLRHVEVGMADQAAAQAAALRDMDAADVGRAFRPGVQRFEQHAAAVVHGQHARIGRGRGVRRGGGAVPCSSAMRAGSGATRASIRARTRPTGPAPRIAMSKAEAVMCGSLTVHYNRRQAACAVTPQER